MLRVNSLICFFNDSSSVCCAVSALSATASVNDSSVDGYQYPLQDGAGIEQARGYNLSF
jgi:hypothetical protein